MRRLATALLVALVATLGYAHAALPAGADVDPASAEAQFVGLINQLRSNNGVQPLEVDSGLQDIAERWAQQMAAANGIRHNPHLVHEVDSEVTTEWTKLGENVGWDYSVQDLFDAFVNSPKHYANLVDPTFSKLGVGVAVTSSGQIFTSHEFMSFDPSNHRDDASAVDAPPPVASSSPPPGFVHAGPPPLYAAVAPVRSFAAAVARPLAVPAASSPVVAVSAGAPTQFVLALQQLSGFDPSRERSRPVRQFVGVTPNRR